MTTSNSVDYSVSRDVIIKAALQKIEAIGSGETPSATQVSEASIALNVLIKAWHGSGMPLWTTKRGYILPVSDVSSCALGASGGHATLSYTRTTTSAASSSGASTITVSSTSGISNGYYIGVELDDGTMQWTTVNGAPSGSTVTLTASLTDDVASGADVYVYSTKIRQPIRVTRAYIVNNGGSEYEINVVGRTDYWALGNKSSEGTPNQVYYDNQLDLGYLYFYPRFSNGDNVIAIDFHTQFEDFDAAGDTPDFPQAWYRPLVWGLAYELSPDYGVPLPERKMMFAEVYGPNGVFEQALNSDTQYGSVYFGVDTSGRD